LRRLWKGRRGNGHCFSLTVFFRCVPDAAGAAGKGAIQPMEGKMRFPKVFPIALACLLTFPGLANSASLEQYLTDFSYQERKEMKVESKELLELLKQGKAQLVDIRFREEHEAWRLGFATNIPLNELPARLGELDKSKIIVTACPHNDRANIARIYLMTKGYQARYLSDGLLSLVELLRGDKAKDFSAGIKP
jgi:rhodanese-related sulfurtransferase